MKKLRPYQLDCVAQMKLILSAGQDPLLISPTGSGKTAMWCKLANDLSRDRAKRILVVVPRKSLVVQALRELADWDLDIGAIAGNMKETRRAQIQIATYQSLATRDIDWLRPDYTILDEAHLSAFPKSVKAWVPNISNYWEHKNRLIGVTATPRRMDKHTSLGELFLPTNIVFAPTIAELITMGYLVRPTYGICPNAISKTMLFDPAYIVKVYQQSDKRPTIVFAPSVAKARAAASAFKAAGIDAFAITGSTLTDDRANAFERFNAEELPVLINCCVLREGIDLPCATNLIMASDPQSHSSYVQSVGRVLRPHRYRDGTLKTTSTIYDLTGCVDVHGRVEDLQYTADDIELPDLNKGEVPMKPCPSQSCKLMSFISARVCKCGEEFDIRKRRIVAPEGDVFALLSGSERVQKAFYEEQLMLAFERGDRPAAARTAFFNRYKFTPPILWRRGFNPNPDVQGWLLTDGLRVKSDWRSRQLALELDF